MELKRILNKYLFLVMSLCVAFSWGMFVKEQYNTKVLDDNEMLELKALEPDYNDVSVYEYYNEWIEQFKEDLKTMSVEDATKQLTLRNRSLLVGETKVTSALVAKDLLVENGNYVMNFQQNVDWVIDNSIKMISNGLFKRGTSAYLNIIKTRYDMLKLKDINVELNNGKAMDAVLNENISHYMLLVVVISVVYQFLAERRKGIWELVHLSSRGRVILALKRIGILATVSFATSIIMYVGMSLIAFYMYGGIESFGAYIQCDSAYMVNEFVMTRWQYILMYILFSGFATLSVGLLVWAVLSIVDNQSIAAIVVAIFGVIEYILFLNIDYKSRYNFLKHINIFKTLLPRDVFREYRNVTFKGHIVGNFAAVVMLAAIIFIVGCVVVLVVSFMKKPITKKSGLTILYERIRNRLSRVLAGMPILGKEFYKIFVSQRGFVIILLGVLFIHNNRIEYGVIMGETDVILNQFYNEAEGIGLGEELDGIRESFENQLEECIAEMEQMKADGEADSYLYTELKVKKAELEMIIACADDNIESLTKLKEKGMEVRIIKPFKYRDILGERISDNQRMVDLVAVFAIILLIFSAYSYEQKQSTIPLLRSTKKGKESFFVLKASTVLVSVLFVWLCIYGYNFANINKIYQLSEFDYPLQGILFMKDFPLEVSVGGYIVLLALEKLMMLVCVATLVLCISCYFNYLTSFIVSVALLLPHIIYLMGAKVFEKLSIVVPLGFSRIYMDNGNSVVTLLPIGIMIAIMIASLILSYRKMTTR